MTYGQFLLVFLLIPIAGLALLVVLDGRHNRIGERRWRGKRAIVVLGCLVLVAVAYTIPWDNHLIAEGVWRYDSSLISGVKLGQIPIEEVLFFPLQTVLVWLWLQWLATRVVRQEPDTCVSDRMSVDASSNCTFGDARRLVATAMESRMRAQTDTQTPLHTGFPGGRIATAQRISVSAGSSVWLVSLLILWSGWQPGTYLAWELVWALPPLILQFAVGADLLWQRRRLLLAALVPVVTYLNAADTVAIHEGIWTISLHRSLGLLLGGVLPVEELIFFLMTSTLVACGLILGGSPELRRRLTGRMSN